jgi:HSP20 family protein
MTLLEQFDALFDLGRDRVLAGNGAVPVFVPAADLVVTDDEVTVFMDVPGLKPEHLEIELTGDVLTVRGERGYPYSTDDQQSGSWYRLERRYGKFQRILQVPKGLDPDSITAEMVDGVLTLHIPQPEARKPGGSRSPRAPSSRRSKARPASSPNWPVRQRNSQASPTG